MSDTRAPSAPTTGVDDPDDSGQSELLRALNARSPLPAVTPEAASAFIAQLAAQILPPAAHKCTRPHIDEMQTWNPPYEAGDGPAN